MAQFKAFSQGVEVNGGTILAFLDGMGTYKLKGQEILAKNGIVNPVEGK